MMRYSYCIYTYKFTVSELKEMLLEAEGEDRETLEAILDETSNHGDDEQITIDLGDECSIRSTHHMDELDIEIDPYIIDLGNFLANWPSDLGDVWS